MHTTNAKALANFRHNTPSTEQLSSISTDFSTLLANQNSAPTKVHEEHEYVMVMKQLLQIATKNAEAPDRISMYKLSGLVLAYMDTLVRDRDREHAAQKHRLLEKNLAYNPTMKQERSSADSYRTRYRNLLNYVGKLLPVRFVYYGAVVLSITCVFATIFIIGLCTKHFVLNPWINVMMLFAGLALTATDIVAIRDWRKRQRVQQTKEQARERD